MLVRLLEGFADYYAINIIGHSAMLRLQLANDCGLITEDIHNFDRNALITSQEEWPRCELKFVLLWVYLKANGLEIRAFFEIEEHLAIHEAVAVIVFVEVPGGHITGVRMFIVRGSILAVEDCNAFEPGDYLCFLTILFHVNVDIRQGEGRE